MSRVGILISRVAIGSPKCTAILEMVDLRMFSESLLENIRMDFFPILRSKTWGALVNPTPGQELI